MHIYHMICPFKKPFHNFFNKTHVTQHFYTSFALLCQWRHKKEHYDVAQNTTLHGNFRVEFSKKTYFFVKFWYFLELSCDKKDLKWIFIHTVFMKLVVHSISSSLLLGDIKHPTRFINTIWNENSIQILYAYVRFDVKFLRLFVSRIKTRVHRDLGCRFTCTLVTLNVSTCTLLLPSSYRVL